LHSDAEIYAFLRLVPAARALPLCIGKLQMLMHEFVEHDLANVVPVVANDDINSSDLDLATTIAENSIENFTSDINKKSDVLDYRTILLNEKIGYSLLILESIARAPTITTQSSTMNSYGKNRKSYTKTTPTKQNTIHDDSHYFDNQIPIGNQIISLYSDFICDHVNLLGTDWCTRFIRALGGAPVLPVDEFWMFILGKQVQEQVEKFNGDQLVVVANSFAQRYLEDDDFFQILVEEIMKKPVYDNDYVGPDLKHTLKYSVDDHHIEYEKNSKYDDISFVGKIDLLWACAKLRYRDEELIRKIFHDVREVYGCSLLNMSSGNNVISSDSGTSGSSSSKGTDGDINNSTSSIATRKADLITTYSVEQRLHMCQKILMGLGHLDTIRIPNIITPDLLNKISQEMMLQLSWRSVSCYNSNFLPGVVGNHVDKKNLNGPKSSVNTSSSSSSSSSTVLKSDLDTAPIIKTVPTEEEWAYAGAWTCTYITPALGRDIPRPFFTLFSSLVHLLTHNSRWYFWLLV